MLQFDIYNSNGPIRGLEMGAFDRVRASSTCKLFINSDDKDDDAGARYSSHSETCEGYAIIQQNYSLPF